MRYPDPWGFQEMHDKLSTFLREIHATRILAATSPAIAADYGRRVHCRSLRASGRVVSGFTPETRERIEQLRAEGVLR